MADIRRYVRLIFDRLSAKKVEDEFSRSLGEAGKKSGDEFLREMRKAFDKRMADLKVQLSTGLIDHREFKKQADLAARTFNTGIVKGMQDAEKAGKLTNKEYLKLSRHMKRVGDVGGTAWERIKRGITSAGLSLAAFFSLRMLARWTREVIALGVAGQETANKYETTFGRATRTMDSFLDSFRGLAGITKTEAREFTSTVGAMARGMGFAEEEAAELAKTVITVAADLTSFNNVPLADTMRAVRSAIVGERESLKTLGIVLRQTDVDQRAMAMSGKENAKALTDQERAAATLELIQERMGPAAGDLVRTQDALANQLRRVGSEWRNMREAFGAVLASWDGGVPVLERVGRALRTMADNAAEVVGFVNALARALLVAAGGGLVYGLVRLGIAIRAATVATVGFAASMRALLPLLGPKGWIVLGVSVLTGWFYSLGKASREAAGLAKQALADYTDAAAAANDFNLTLMESSLDAMDAAIRARLAQIRHGGAAVRDEQRQLIQELNGIQARMRVLAQERQGRTPGRTAGTGGTPPGSDGASKTAKAQAAELERINRELAIRLTMAERETTRELAAEFVRRQEILTGVTRQTVTDIQDGWARLDAMDLLSRAGMDKPITPQVKITPIDREMTHWQEQVAVSAETNAKRTSSAWVDNLEAIADQVQASTGIFNVLGDAWAEGSLQGIARAAVWYAKDSAAQAIRQLALAVGSLFGFNPGKAAAHFQSAALHGAAAVAFKAIGGGGGGASSAGSLGASPSNTASAAKAEAARQDVTLIFTGKGWPAMDADFQKSVHQAGLLARERFGNNVNLKIERR